MKTHTSFSFRKLAGAGALGAMALTLVIAAGSRQSEAAPKPASEASSSSIAASRIDNENYTVEIKTAGAGYKANQEGTVDIKIEAKGDYHLNAKYPVKFTLTDPAPEGVKYPKAVLKREDGKFEDKTGGFSVPFVASRAGKAKISGKLSVSVCSDKNCLMEKLDLELDVDVK